MFVWDYNIKDNWQPGSDKEWEWFLVRKINYGDFEGLKIDMLKKYFQNIQKQLDPGKRAMIENFLLHYNHEKKL